MANKSALSQYRKKLRTKETNFRRLLTVESDEFEKDFLDKLKQAGYITGGLIAGYLMYKMVAPKEPKASKKDIASSKSTSKTSEKLNATIKDKLTAFAVQLAISYVSEKLKNRIPDDRDTQSTKN